MKICAAMLFALGAMVVASAARALPPAQQECYVGVQSWQTQYSLSAQAADRACGSSRCSTQQSASATGPTTLTIPPTCAVLGWVRQGNAVTASIHDTVISPCLVEGSSTQTVHGPSAGGRSSIDLLNIDLRNGTDTGTYTYKPGPIVPATDTIKGCGNPPTDLGVSVPMSPIDGKTWPKTLTLPPTVQPLVGKLSFEALAPPGGNAAGWKFDFSLTPDYTPDEDCKQPGGSTIGCQSQSLGEAVRLVGTGFALHYESSRAPGGAGNTVAVADAAMIGGWTLTVHHAYDPATHTLFLGDGTQRNGYQLGAPVKFNGNLLLAAEDGSEIYAFDALTGRHVQTQRPLTGVVAYAFGYDAAGKLVKVTDAFGNATTIRRNAAGRPSSIVSPYGQVTVLKFDGHGLLREVADPLGHAAVFINTATGLMTSRIDANGNTYAYSYNQRGGLSKDADSAGGFTALTRANAVSGLGWTVARQTAAGRTSSYQSTIDMPWVQSKTSPYSEHHTNSWPGGLQGIADTSLRNGVLSRGAALSNATSFSATLGPDPVWGLQVPVAKTAALTEGDLTMSLAATRNIGLKQVGNPFSVTSETDTQTVNGRNYTAHYTGSSRSWLVSTPVGRTMTVKLDPLERIASAQLAGLFPKKYAYDGRGRLASVTRGSRTTTFAYDADGFLAAVTDPLNQTTHFTRDADGRLLAATRPDGRVTNYAYDANGNLVSLAPPGKSAHTFGYTAVNLISSAVPPVVPGTGATGFSYDLDRLPTRTARPDGSQIGYAYDAAGRLVSVATPTGTTTYAYAAGTGNLMRAARGGETIAYSYDGPLLTKSAWSGKVSGNVGRAWNADLRIASQSVAGGKLIAFAYDEDRLLTQAGQLAITRGGDNGLITGAKLAAAADSRSYNGYGELVGYTATAKGAALYSVEYVRDAAGRITATTEKIAGVTNRYAYTYDAAGRLVKAVKNGVADTYDYDSNSNRLSAKVGGAASEGTYDAQDRLLRYGSAHYAYTANGELAKQTVGAKTSTYTYDVLGNLIAATLADGTKITYVVDAENHRVGKAVNGKPAAGFLYDGNAVLAQLDGGSKLVSQFVYATRSTTPDYMIRGGATYRIFSDQLGSPVLVVNAATGAVAERIAYDAFGNVTEDTNPGLQPFRFAGGLYDPDTGLLRFGMRDYDPKTGRWTAKDRVLFAAGDTNLYAYALGDPVNLTDVSGLQSETGAPEAAAPLSTQIADPSPGSTGNVVVDATLKISDWSRRLHQWIKEKTCRKCEERREEKEVENNGTTAKELAKDQTTHVVVEATAEVAGEAAEMEVAGKAVGPALTAVEASKALAEGLIASKVHNDKLKDALNNAQCAASH